MKSALVLQAFEAICKRYPVRDYLVKNDRLTALEKLSEEELRATIERIKKS